MNIRAKPDDKREEGYISEVIKDEGKICSCPECGTKILNAEKPCPDFKCPNCGQVMEKSK